MWCYENFNYYFLKSQKQANLYRKKVFRWSWLLVLFQQSSFVDLGHFEQVAWTQIPPTDWQIASLVFWYGTHKQIIIYLIFNSPTDNCSKVLTPKNSSNRILIFILALDILEVYHWTITEQLSGSFIAAQLTVCLDMKLKLTSMRLM